MVRGARTLGDNTLDIYIGERCGDFVLFLFVVDCLSLSLLCALQLGSIGVKPSTM